MRRFPWFLGLSSWLLFAFPSSADTAGGRRLVVLFDTSRSIPAAAFEQGLALVRGLEALVQEGVEVAVWSVDDRGEFRGGLEALSQFERRGRRTLLHDALLAAVRSAGRGGLVLLVSDAIDDGSATSAEDVGRIARELGVPIYAVGMGRVNEKALRRLALLSGGEVMGSIGQLEPAPMLERLRTSWRQLEPPPPPQEPAPTPSPPVSPEASAAPASATGSPPANWFLILIGVGLLALGGGGVGAYLAARMQRKRKVPTEGAEADYGTSPGVLPPHLSHASSSEVLEELDPVRVAEIRALAPVRRGALAEVPEGEVDAPFQLPRDQVFEKTLVLQDEVVLAVHETGKPVRAYKLPERRAVWIGRDPSRNTLVFSDPTLSGQHLRLVLGVDGTVDLVDSDSTNGTYVRDRKVKNCRLKPGERFRAGLIEFELKVLHRSPA